VIEFLQANWLTLAFLAALAAFFILLRSRQTKVDGIDAIWAPGDPVVIEVYNNT
jgi:hypothetical protein